MGYDQFGSAANQATGRVHALGPAPIDRAALQHAIEGLIKERRSRHAFFAANLFSEPAWDILLVMALAESRHQRMTISRLCDGVDAPMTTALRWISALTEKGLLVRRDDVNDKRRKFIELSPHALAAMAAYCSRLRSPLPIAA